MANVAPPQKATRALAREGLDDVGADAARAAGGILAIMVSEESLRQKIEGRRKAIRKLDRERDKLAGEIAAFEEILADMKEMPAQGRVHEAEITDGAVATDRTLATRGLSTSWKAIIRRLSREQTFNYDDVVTVASKCDLDFAFPMASFA